SRPAFSLRSQPGGRSAYEQPQPSAPTSANESARNSKHGESRCRSWERVNQLPPGVREGGILPSQSSMVSPLREAAYQIGVSGASEVACARASELAGRGSLPGTASIVVVVRARRLASEREPDSK